MNYEYSYKLNSILAIRYMKGQLKHTLSSVVWKLHTYDSNPHQMELKDAKSQLRDKATVFSSFVNETHIERKRTKFTALATGALVYGLLAVE